MAAARRRATGGAPLSASAPEGLPPSMEPSLSTTCTTMNRLSKNPPSCSRIEGGTISINCTIVNDCNEPQNKSPLEYFIDHDNFDARAEVRIS